MLRLVTKWVLIFKEFKGKLHWDGDLETMRVDH